MKTRRFHSLMLAAAVAVSAVGAAIAAPRAASTKPAAAITFTTKSKEARSYAEQAVHMIESFQFGPEFNQVAVKAMEADPNFAFAHYLVGVSSNSLEEAKPHFDKSIELAKTASDGERRYLEATALNRAQQPAKALEAFKALAVDYPNERMVQMMIAQLSIATGDTEGGRAALERAIKIDGSTARAYSMLGNYYLLKGDYTKARQLYATSLDKANHRATAFGPTYGTAYTYVYEGNYQKAIDILMDYQARYTKEGGFPQLPAVFIWNSIARLNLENGHPEEALKYYQKGYETVPTSDMPADQKTIWLGRLHHGTGRSLAKLGKYDDAWKEADLIKKMIEDGGEEGKQFWGSYHYIAGYLKLEQGDYAGAIEHLKQTDLNDAFHALLLARAYEKAGNDAEAQKLYKQIVDSTTVNLERAISYGEAKKKLKA